MLCVSFGENVSILITIVSFILGLGADALIRNRQKKVSLVTMKKATLFWYDCEKKGVLANVESINAMAEAISSAVRFQSEGANIQEVDLARLNDFRLDELCSAFVENIKTGEQDERMKFLYTFQKGCRYIDCAISEVRRIHEHYVDDIRSLMEEWNRPYKHMQDEIRESLDPVIKERWNSLTERCVSEGGGNRDCIDVEKWENLVIDPYLEFMVSKKPSRERELIIADLNSLKIVLLKFRETRNYGQLFKKYAVNIMASLKSLEPCAAFMRTAIMKCWVQ